MKTREQLRAERASTMVAGIKADSIQGYIAEVRAFPTMVFQGGLAPALAQLRAKSSPPRQALYEHVSSWVCEVTFNEPKGDALTLIVKNPANQLIRAQDEALSLLSWLKRFAEAREPKGRKP